MISRQLIVLLVVLLSTNSQALKGARRRSRQLQEVDIFDKTDKEVGSAAPKELLDDGTPKDKGTNGKEKEGKNADKKSDKKEDKQKDKKKNKKDCKKRPKTEKEPAPKGGSESEPAAKSPLELSENEEQNAETRDVDAVPDPKDTGAQMVTTSEQDANEPWCEDESIKKWGDCEELAAGKFPKSSEIAIGSLALEVTSKKDSIVEEMERKLKQETSLIAVGCGGRRLQNLTDANVMEVYLLAVDITGLSEKSENCTNSKTSADAICTVMASDVTIHYSGNATADQKIALFDSLTKTIRTQAEEGDFDDLASVHFAEARILDGEEEDNYRSSSKPSGDTSSGIIGGVAAALAVAVLVIGVIVYKKKRSEHSDGCGPATVGPSERAVIAVFSDDVEIINATVW